MQGNGITPTFQKASKGCCGYTLSKGGTNTSGHENKFSFGQTDLLPAEQSFLQSRKIQLGISRN
ncbi:hypothetical protein LEP1GSC192_1655 [Leptospira sp. B5-022]|nr:hypothetical protein LEP1GSC192_1655 [Leptospira sp. B5-022]